MTYQRSLLEVFQTSLPAGQVIGQSVSMSSCNDKLCEVIPPFITCVKSCVLLP